MGVKALKCDKTQGTGQVKDLRSNVDRTSPPNVKEEVKDDSFVLE